MVWVILLTATMTALSQNDPIFTQYLTNVQTVNPAYAGMWDKKGFQLLTRQYYVGFDRAPLTQNISLYSPVKNENNGIGLNLMYDRLGYETRMHLTFDYAYQVRVNWDSFLRFGVKFGFLNYDNYLTRVKLYPDYKDDVMFQEDIEIRFLPMLGVGAIYYAENYFIGFSVPQMINNNFLANRNNYSTLAELSYGYLTGGYVYPITSILTFKPSALLKGALGYPLQLDVATNFIFLERFWFGTMYRTNHTMAVVAQWLINRNLKIGYAIDYSLSKDIRRYHIGSHEVMLGYELDVYKRNRWKRRYF